MEDKSVFVLKRRINAPRYIAAIIALIGVALLFVPIVSATPDYAEELDAVEKSMNIAKSLGYNEHYSLTPSELRDISLYSFGWIAYNEIINEDPIDARHWLAFMLLPGAGALIAFITALCKRPILTFLMNAIASGAYALDIVILMDGPMSDRPYSWSYMWGAAYYAYPVVFSLLFIASIWMLCARHKWKKARKRARKAQIRQQYTQEY